jgi:hypothetical protein
MTVTTHALIPALQDTRDAHAAVIDRFRMDMAVTPVGPHRLAMEHHLAHTQEHMARIDDHVRAIRPRRLLSDTAAIVRTLASGAIRAVHLPIEACAMITAGVLLGGRPADERHLLLTIEGEYAAAAHALAACRVGESIAALADDETAMDLLDSLRHQDEELLETLETSLEQLAQALVDAAEGMHTGARMSVVARDQLWPGSRPRTEDRPGAGPAATGPKTVTPAAWARSMTTAKHRMGTTG